MNKLVCLFSALLLVGVTHAQESEPTEDSTESAQVDGERKHHRRGGRNKKDKDMLERVDTNQDGQVDLNEFLAHAESRFQKMDLDANGFVTGEERREAGDKMREKHREMREERKQAREQRRAESANDE